MSRTGQRYIQDAYRLDDPPSSPTSEGSHTLTGHRHFCKRESVRLAKAKPSDVAMMNLLMNLASSHPHRENHAPPAGHLGVWLPIGTGTPEASLPYAHLEHAIQGSICAAWLKGSSLQCLRLIYIAEWPLRRGAHQTTSLYLTPYYAVLRRRSPR